MKFPFSTNFEQIPATRRTDLEALGNYIAEHIAQGLPVQIIVICTHNSRRSHMGQIALQAAAQHFDLEGVSTYSGGTEATAFNHRSVAALREIGFDLVQKTDGDNPIYELNLGQKMDLFSKKYDSPPNPKEDFAAIMVCTDADEGCPYVAGADARFSLPFDDPKAFDDTPREAEMYATRLQQIGNEMTYAMWWATQVLEL